MSSLPLPPWFRTLGFALGGLALAIWLSVFFHDPKQPSSPEQRADLLAASNYAALSLFAPLPPSAPHWEQLLVLQAPGNKGRYPIAHEAAALTIALAGGSPRIATVLALGAASLSLGWLLNRRPRPRTGIDALVTGLALLAICHGQAWQLTDPHPFLILAFSALALGAWFELQKPPAKKTSALLLGAGLSGLLLSSPVLFTCFIVSAVADLVWRLLKSPSVPGAKIPVPVLLVAALPVLLSFLALGARNQAVIGSPWQSPSAYYLEHKTSARVWFWDGVRAPPARLDPVMERYDELVLIPRTQWQAPIYKIWLERLFKGAYQAGGVVLAALALLVLLNRASARTHMPLLLLLGMAAIFLLYYSPNPPWWTFATAPLAWLVANGGDILAPLPLARRNFAALSALQLLTVIWGPQNKPLPAEVFFQNRMAEVAEKVRQTPGKHLIFTNLDDSADGRLEPADLHRDWDAYTILYARDLEPAQNSALVASMPGRTVWRIVIFGNRIGLQRWPPPAATPAAPSSPPAPAAPAASPVPAPETPPAPAAPAQS